MRIKNLRAKAFSSVGRREKGKIMDENKNNGHFDFE